MHDPDLIILDEPTVRFCTGYSGNIYISTCPGGFGPAAATEDLGSPAAAGQGWQQDHHHHHPLHRGGEARQQGRPHEVRQAAGRGEAECAALQVSIYYSHNTQNIYNI